jgi:APA family basic amino acid/polyamine antiporter
MAEPRRLQQTIGVPGAVILGLGAMMGTGVYVAMGLAAGLVGDWLLVTILVASVVATCNALSSAQLAAAHPISGGTYEYAYRYLNPTLGFSAGWFFLCAKSASAATAALGAGGYLVSLAAPNQQQWAYYCGLVLVVFIGAVAYSGVAKSKLTTFLLVFVSLGTLVLFIALAVTSSGGVASEVNETVILDITGLGFLEATALVFVAFTGYGRIATLGEEVHEPRRTIPLAVYSTVAVVTLVYLGVAWQCLAVLGVGQYEEAAREGLAPVSLASQMLGYSWLPALISVGALCALLGSLLNLILGLSRVYLAMGRRNDLPPAFARINEQATTPSVATLTSIIVIFVIALMGSIKAAWSFSALSVLLYYTLANSSALMVSVEDRFIPRWVSVIGLVCCATLAVAIEPIYWLIAAGLVLSGFIIRAISQRMTGKSPAS